jgi:hypothetical protein
MDATGLRARTPSGPQNTALTICSRLASAQIECLHGPARRPAKNHPQTRIQVKLCPRAHSRCIPVHAIQHDAHSARASPHKTQRPAANRGCTPGRPDGDPSYQNPIAPSPCVQPCRACAVIEEEEDFVRVPKSVLRAALTKTLEQLARQPTSKHAGRRLRASAPMFFPEEMLAEESYRRSTGCRLPTRRSGSSGTRPGS